MKTVFLFIAFAFISMQTVVAQSESDDSSPTTTTTTTTTSNVDTGDLAQKIANQINACETMTCFVSFYNRFAKVTSGFSNKKTGVNIMVEILKLMDKKRPGLLFDVYMKADKKYQSFFIKCVKKLPKNLREDMVRKAKNYNK